MSGAGTWAPCWRSRRRRQWRSLRLGCLIGRRCTSVSSREKLWIAGSGHSGASRCVATATARALPAFRLTSSPIGNDVPSGARHISIVGRQRRRYGLNSDNRGQLVMVLLFLWPYTQWWGLSEGAWPAILARLLDTSALDCGTAVALVS